MTGKSTSLTEFAKGRKRASSGAWFDTLPDEVKQQCIEGWKQGLRATVIAEWLKAEGYDATSGRVAVIAERAKDG